MKDALKEFSSDLADELTKHFQSDELKQLISSTKDTDDSASGTFEVVITTENLDRYQEVIKLDGWELDNYLSNPIVLWMHDHTQPIGIATALDKRDGKLVAKGKFAGNAKGQEVRALYDAGIIKATSVGFIEKERQGNLITKAELLEFSFVSVPANPYALTLAMERNYSVNELVTKGLMFVEKTQEGEGQPEDEPVGDEEPAADPEPDTPAEPPVAPQERSFSTRQLTPAIDSLRAALAALEALDTVEEPEGGAANDNEERAFEEFSAGRKLLQDAATMLGGVLAESRRVIEARN